MSVELVLYDRAAQALDAASTVDEIKEVHDLALALQLYARQAHDRVLVDRATGIRVRAERKAGAKLREMKARGERDSPGGDRKSKSQAATLKKLKDFGITKTNSSRWQRLSDLAPSEFERRLAAAQKRAVDALDMTPDERSAEKKARRAQHEAELTTKIRALPNKRYGLILADPEWRFVPWSEETGSDRSAANHYATSALAQIKSRDVPSIAAEDCVLFLWATVPLLPQALEVMAHWGFTYKSHIIWLKSKVGMGYWYRNVHELLLVGTKGDVPGPAPGQQWESAFDADVGAHSEKPEEAYQMIMHYFPTVPKIELNARKKREGFDVWGADAPVDLVTDDGFEGGTAVE